MNRDMLTSNVNINWEHDFSGLVITVAVLSSYTECRSRAARGLSLQDSSCGTGQSFFILEVEEAQPKH